MRIRGTDFVMFEVSDLARAAAFYRDTLGLPQEVFSEEDQWAEFNCGNVTLSLHGGTKPEEIAGGTIALAAEDVHAAYAELKSKGARASPGSRLTTEYARRSKSSIPTATRRFFTGGRMERLGRMSQAPAVKRPHLPTVEASRRAQRKN